ncbi:HNH endonuclease [Candidatus Pantoea formicae]|uniref:HNH endonuclease n=1 Tax=Candidatus Pantoea formicae TaxID=2608355 RepID=UPI003EDB2506
MKMTRLEAIKEWGKASREGRPIPDSVKTVLLSTQNEQNQTPLIIPAKVAVFSLGDNLSNRKTNKSKDSKSRDFSEPLSSKVIGALTSEQMDSYNKKLAGKISRRSALIKDFIQQGLSNKEASRRADQLISSEKFLIGPKDNEKKLVKATIKSRGAKQKTKKSAKNDPWLLAKEKQDEMVKTNRESLRIEGLLAIRPVSCIACKISFKTFNNFVDHSINIHKKSVKNPRLIKGEVGNENKITETITKSNYFETKEEPLSVSQVEVIKLKDETFEEKWIRLFAEKGYSVFVVEAFKREALKIKMNVREIRGFLDVCKPSNPTQPVTVQGPNQDYGSDAGEELSAETGEEFSQTIPPINIHTLKVIPDSLAKAVFTDRTVKYRVNQNDFKERVSKNFGHHCAITGSGEALEAAHIEPVGSGNNNTSNGVLMLSCLHRLFDIGLMTIEPNALTVHFKKECTYFAKDILEGKALRRHNVSLNKEGLNMRWCQFKPE